MSKSVLQIIQEAFTQAEVEIDNFNELFDAHDVLESENKFLKMQLATVQDKLAKQEADATILQAKYTKLESQCDQVYANGEKHLITVKQSLREKGQMADKLSQATDLLKDYKSIDTPKKIRTKFKDYQERIAKGLKATEFAKGETKLYRKEITSLKQMVQTLRISETQSNMTTMWAEDGDFLMVFPAKLSMQVGDRVEQQMTLLYMTKSGCAKLIGLSEDGLPQVCSMPKGGLEPKAKTLRVAGEVLRKWRRQSWKLELSDLDLGSK